MSNCKDYAELGQTKLAFGLISGYQTSNLIDEISGRLDRRFYVEYGRMILRIIYKIMSFPTHPVETQQ